MKKKLIKKLFKLSIFCFILSFIISNNGKLIINNIINKNNKIHPNKYYINNDGFYFKNYKTYPLIARDKQDIKDIYFTFVNSGEDEISFICDNNYTDCRNDVLDFSNNQDELSDLNSYIHPYNNFLDLKTEINALNIITIKSGKAYQKEDIKLIEEKINFIDQHIVKSEKDPRKIIKLLHDYLILNITYQDTGTRSNIAIGALIDNKAICGGYTDTMAILLSHYNIRNIKVTSKTHTWNAVKLEGKWYHLDLTWDDGKSYIDYSYFLIDTNRLLLLDMLDKDHNHLFNKKIYQEFYN